MQPPIRIATNKLVDVELPAKQREEVIALQVRSVPVIDKADGQETGYPVQHLANFALFHLQGTRSRVADSCSSKQAALLRVVNVHP